MSQDLIDIIPVGDVAVEHVADQVDALITDGVRHSQSPVHDLVDAVEGVLLVDDGVQQDAESPNVLFPATVRLAC